MKKIGILTFHKVPNYGAVLQALALKEYLQKVSGGEVSVLDFQCPGNSDDFFPQKYFDDFCASKKILKKVAKKILVYMFAQKAYKKKYEKFNKFREQYLNVIPYTTQIYDDLDFIFCGSDQIWNTDITKGFKPQYFGANKPTGSNTVIASYAASCGDISEFSNEKKRCLFEIIQNLDQISVREKTLAETLMEAEIDAVQVMDPTFLLNKENYFEIFNYDNEKPIVFQYELQKDPVLDKISQKIAMEKGLDIVKVCGYPRLSNEKGLFDIGPTEFMQLFLSAKYVVTNSFHGTALSLILEKDFNSVLPKSRRGRITDLLNLIDLSNRICHDENNVNTEPINYKIVTPVLKKQINFSMAYIERVLNERKG